MEKQPPAEFVQGLNAALSYWQERIGREPPTRLERERHNLYRAVQLGLALPGTQPLAAEVATGAFPFIYARGYWREWLSVMERAARTQDASFHGATWQSVSRFWLLTRLGQLRRLNGRLSDAVRCHQEALDVARETTQSPLIAEGQYQLGRALRDARRYAESEEHLLVAERLMAQVAEAGSDEHAAALAANVQNALGRVMHDLGRLDEAQKHLSRAVAMRRKQGQPVPLADALQDLGNALRADGSYDQALKCYEEGLRLLEGTDYPLNCALIQLGVGAVHFARRDYELAETVFRQIDVRFLRQTGNLHVQAMVFSALGNSILYQNRHGEAAQTLRESVELWRQLEDKLELANAVGSLGEALARLAENIEARELFAEALDLLAQYPASAKARRLHAFFTAERAKLAGTAET